MVMPRLDLQDDIKGEMPAIYILYFKFGFKFDRIYAYEDEPVCNDGQEFYCVEALYRYTGALVKQLHEDPALLQRVDQFILSIMWTNWSFLDLVWRNGGRCGGFV